MLDIRSLTRSFDRSVDDALAWLDTHGGWLFTLVRALLDGLFAAVDGLLQWVPFYGIALVFGLLGWRIVGARFGLLAAIGLLFCAGMGLWAETMQTMALVLTACLLALLIAVPVGVLAGYHPRLNAALTPVLDMIQTLPPYIYLLPAIALLGFGPATALAATVVVAIPPALKLTALGIRHTPTNFLELGQASGSSGLDLFWKIRLPFALPSIMAGVNQCLMMAFGMVVIAGIVGSGGLGTTIYDAVRTLDIAKSIDAGIAIVILTMVIDRLTEGAIREGKETAA